MFQCMLYHFPLKWFVDEVKGIYCGSLTDGGWVVVGCAENYWYVVVLSDLTCGFNSINYSREHDVHKEEIRLYFGGNLYGFFSSRYNGNYRMSYFFDGCFQVFCCDSFILSDDDCSFHLLPLATIFQMRCNL